jgi:hypothetical protein
MSNDQIYHATCRAEQMSLTKLMKEEGKRSKSASPVVNGPEGVKVEKRKPEDEVDDEDLSKRARLAAGVAAEESTRNSGGYIPNAPRSRRANPRYPFRTDHFRSESRIIAGRTSNGACGEAGVGGWGSGATTRGNGRG